MSAPDDSFDIAIVGLACRFPGAADAAQFWSNLATGVESISTLSDEEMTQAGVPESHLSAPNYVKAAPVLDEPGGFDAALFGFTAEEARTMDPQHRILLELALEALEDAGCDPQRFPGRIGVFAGSAMNTYFMHAGLKQRFAEEYIPTLIVNDKDFLSTRLSYKLNLTGPSVTLQTACSTSLVAVHFARQSLLAEESDVALAGAISVRVPHRAGYLADAGGISSPTGHVRAFDAAADGTIFGSGGGVVVLKRLRDALAAGDTVHAIIKGSAINNDGSDKAGYTAPSVDRQAEVIVEALANADVDAESISYVEAHGSGTPVGDPIEIRALTKAFRSSTERTAFCAIGSVKTNLGHLDAAAGMAGLIKTVLALRHGQIPASLNFSKPNPEIDFPATPFFVNTALVPWNSSGGPRRAGIMSTGMGGTNAHVVLEEAPPQTVVAESAQPGLLLLSARTESALAASAGRLRTFLDRHPDVRLHDAAFTLQTGRRTLEHRRFVVAADRVAAIASLAQKASRFNIGRVADGAVPPVVLLLPGVGDHYVGMGRDLYLGILSFRREVDRCAGILQPLLGVDIREVLYPKNRDWTRATATRGIDLKKMLAGNTEPPDDEDTRRLNLPAHLQPALFTVEYALAQMWTELGITPQAIVGHSMGEYVAACLAGTFSLEDALRLIVSRTQLANQLPSARMLAVSLSEAELQPLLPESLSISLINGPNLCVVAGPSAAVADFEQKLTARGLRFRPVQNTHAFHSRVLDPVVGEFEAEVRKVRLQPPRIPFVSNVTGRWISNAEATDPAYWAKHLNHTARFHDALQTTWQMDCPVLLEAGPGKTLGVLAMQHPARQNSASLAAASSLRHHYENQPDLELLLNSVGKLWLSGLQIHWEKLPGNQERRKISLPAYPFERQNYWLEPEAPHPVANLLPARRTLGPVGIDQWFHVPSWERSVFPAAFPSPSSAKILWLILAAEEEQAASVRRYLASLGASTTVAISGDRFEKRSENAFTFDAAKSDHYLQLLTASHAGTFAALHIVHLECVAPSETESADDLSSSSAHSGFFSLLYLAQAMAELNLAIPTAIGVVTNQLHEVIGEEELRPEFAPVLGLCGVIPRELPHVTTFNIDLAGREDFNAVHDSTTPRLVSEFGNPVAGQIIAYRGKHRWKKTYQPVALPPLDVTRDSAAPRIPKRLRQRGVYLITGGAGGIGTTIAKYLARTSQARLVLTRRTPFPRKAEWLSVMGNSSTPPATVALINDLLEIERLGGEAEIMVADVTDAEKMREVIAHTRQNFQALHGVIHAAGIARAGLIQTTTKEMAEAMLAPKVRGTLVLHELLKGANLDFLVLFSSLASVTHPFAHADYSAANSFLDAFAAYSNSREQYHTLSINWPIWKEVGMVMRSEVFMGVETWKEEALRRAILTKDGLEVFARALDADYSQLVVSPEPLLPTLAQPRETIAETPKVEPASTTERTLPKEENSEPANPTEQKLREIWQDIFGLSRIGLQESFFDLGGHSLLALRIISRIARTFRINLPLRSVFEAPTIAQLASAVQSAEEGGHSPSTAETGSSGLKTTPVPAPAAPRVLATYEAQRGLWAIGQFGHEAVRAYNDSTTLELRGPLDVEALRTALQLLADRHEAFRTTFGPDGEELVIHPLLDLAMAVEDISAVIEAGREERLRECFLQFEQHAFDLTQGPILKVLLLRLETERHLLTLKFHHSLGNGPSYWIFFEELTELYAAVRNGRPAALEAPLQLTDYLQWRAARTGTAQEQADEAFWREQFAGELPALELPADHTRPALRTFHGGRQALQIDETLTQRLRETGARQQSSLFMVLFATFKTLLFRLSNQRDLVVGVPYESGVRELPGGAHLFANTTNMVPLRTQLDEEMPFPDLLASTKSQVLATNEHQEYFFGTLLPKLGTKLDLSRPPLFSVTFNFESGKFERDAAGVHFGLLTENVPYRSARDIAPFELVMNIAEKDGALLVECDFNSDLFAAESVKHWLWQYLTLLKDIAANPAQPLGRFALLDEAERRKVLVDYNDTALVIPAGAVHEWVAARAAAVPGAIAVECEERQLTYAQLEFEATQLAAHLQQLGVGPEKLVGVCVDRSVEMVAAVLGVLKTGAAYVPLDPAFPAARLAMMIEDAAMPVIVTTGSLVATLPTSAAKLVCLDAMTPESIALQPVTVSPEDRAYVIFTSGSTGRPKGVQIPHRAFANFLESMRGRPGFAATDRLLAVTTLSFDIAGLELFLPLITGGTAVIATQETAVDPIRLMAELERSRATVMQATPATWRALLSSGWNGSPSLKILVGGEAVPADLVAELLPRSREIWNMYGPTETTVWSTVEPLTSAAAPIAIGRPIANTQAYVLNRSLELQPFGLSGELHLGGIGLALGYLGQPELTAQKFIADPFSQAPGARLYKTGDLARYLPDGRIECLGRLDQQLKVRGFRIERGEIEAVFRAHPQVRDAAVTVRKSPSGDERLAAYYTLREGSSVEELELRRHLQQVLPVYMLPGVMVPLNALPLTPNGKVDYKALPEISLSALQPREIVSAETPIQKELVALWEELLDRRPIGIRDSFFDLGGHSLLAIRMISRVARQWSVNLPLRGLFEAPTIADVAAAIQAAPKSSAAAVEAAPIPVARRVRRESPKQPDPRPTF